MLRTILILLMLALHITAQAEWQVLIEVDAITDVEKRIALVINEEGYSFTVYRVPPTDRDPEGAVWGNFSLSSQTPNQMDRDKLPVFRIDRLDPYDLDLFKKFAEILMEFGSPDSFDPVHPLDFDYSWTPKWINFRMPSGELQKIMQGNQILFRYYLPSGGYEDTTFELTGSSSAIREAFQLENLDLDVAAAEETAEETAEEATEKALDAENRDASSLATETCFLRHSSVLAACITVVTECSSQLGRDVETFRACVAIGTENL